MLVAALNLQGGGWVLPPYPDWTLYHDKKIAAIWGIEDVQEQRPDLTADQAWEVLRRVNHHHDPNHGITWETLRLTAEELFPKKRSRTPRRTARKSSR